MIAGDIYKLASGRQLGDGIVPFIVEFVRLGLNKEETESFHIFSCFFFQSYLRAVVGMNVLEMEKLPAEVFPQLQRHTPKQMKIFSKEYLIVPILNE